MSEAVFEAIRDQLPSGCMVDETAWSGGALCYGLVCLTRPEIAVEIGAHRGTTSAYIVRAQHELGFGRFIGYELNSDRCAESESRLNEAFPLGAWKIEAGDFFSKDVPEGIGFCFMDIDPKESYIPAYEKVRFADNAVIVAHDLTHQAHVGNLLAFKNHLLADGWESIGLPYERGFLVAVKS